MMQIVPKMSVVVAIVMAGMIGVVADRWLVASPPIDAKDSSPVAAPPAKPRSATPVSVATESPVIAPVRKTDVVLRLPVGTYTKEIEAAPYGSGRITWTYTDDNRVLGRVVVSMMGVELDFSTEADIAMASTGTVYGVLTEVSLNKVRVVGSELAELQAYAGFASLAEPLIGDFLVDLPFSYRCQVSGDRLVIRNFRTLLAGTNPVARLGPLAGEMGEIGGFLMYFQAINVVLEGTYRSSDASPTDKVGSGGHPGLDRNVSYPQRSTFRFPGTAPTCQDGKCPTPGSPVVTIESRPATIPPLR